MERTDNGQPALVLVNGGPASVQAPRARYLFPGDVHVCYKSQGRIASAVPIARALRAAGEGLVYCLDLGMPGAPLAALHRRSRPGGRLVYEIGDPAERLLANQHRPWLEVTTAGLLDSRLPLIADQLVFRGSYLMKYFEERLAPRQLPRRMWLPDGVDCAEFKPMRTAAAVESLRDKHGLRGRFIVGLVGNIHHDRINNLFYGWELAEALAHIPADVPVTGVVVGDGPGSAVLEAARARLGLGDRLRLVGRVPHADVPTWMNLFDVALSTQTDDPVGWGRTTAKLPEYLACGTPVICTDVGEAHRWLAGTGQTLPYRGMRDDTYPARLAARLTELRSGDLSTLRDANRRLAVSVFDYEVLRQQLRDFLRADAR